MALFAQLSRLSSRSRSSLGRRVKAAQSLAASRNVSTEDICNKCEENVIDSPFPSIPDGPYAPLAEFVWKNWDDNVKGKVAMVDGSTGLQRTFGDMHSTAGSLAAVLKYEMGISEGGTVALLSPNHVDYLPISLAVSLTGAKMTPVNPLYTAAELATVLERSHSTVLIAHVNCLDVALEAAKKSAANIQHVIVVTDSNGEAIPEGTVDLDQLRNHDKAFYETVPSVHPKTDTHTYLLPYSSGTTGLPKGVMLTHENIVANLLQMDAVEGISYTPEKNQKLISPLPFFHIYAFTASMFYSAWKEVPVITTSGRFDLETFCKLIEEHKPKRAHLVPPIVLGLAKHPLIDNYDLSSLELILSAAAPLSDDIETAVKDRLNLEVKQAWGMSELSPIGTISSDSDIKSGSIGPLVSSTYGKIVDEEGNSLPPNEAGELLIKGPQVMAGYLDDEEKTKETMCKKSGWLRTGDVGYYDIDGFFFVTDRIKEMIKVRGFPVAPAELEALLLTNDHVNDVAVIQIPDEKSGEVPRAYIVLKEGAKGECSEEDIYQWVKERVAPYKRLDGGVIFTDTIPKSASGKILRRILRDEAKKEQEAAK